MQHRIPLSIDPVQAKQAAEKAWAHYSQRFARFHPSIRWQNENQAAIDFHAMGVHLKGSVSIEPGSLLIDFHVPFLLRPFEKQALTRIEHEVAQWLQER